MTTNRNEPRAYATLRIGYVNYVMTLEDATTVAAVLMGAEILTSEYVKDDATGTSSYHHKITPQTVSDSELTLKLMAPAFYNAAKIAGESA